MELKIALLQVNIDFSDHEKNLSKAFDLIYQSASIGCNFLVMPELWFSGFCYEDLHGIAKQTRKILHLIKQLCKEHSIYISGSYLTQFHDCFYNSQILIGPGDVCFKQYRKIHLMHALNEHKYFLPGNRIITNQISDLIFGFAICFDLRFPSLFTALRSKGTNIILLPAQWPAKRIEHWKVLTRARAIENQCYVIAVNGVGKSGDVLLGGCSLIIDPWGEVLAMGETNEQQIVTSVINSEVVNDVRSSFPISYTQ